MSQRRIVLKNILNCRDLGGFPSEYGTTKYGRFLRAGIVEYPEDWETDILGQYGVTTAIDLRGDFEVDDMSPRLDRIRGCDTYNISLYEANVANANDDEHSLAEIYISIADNYRENMKTVLEAIADAKDGVVMYHCFFGKDRTGILTLLLLTIAGVAEEDIVADYQVTYTYIKKYVDEHSATLWSRDRKMHYSLPETMEKLIEHMKNEYGSVYDYIVSTGIDEEKIEKIRRRFFD